MPRILRSTLLYVALLVSVESGLSACVVYPYDGEGYRHYRDHGDHHHQYDHRGHDYRW